MYFFFLAKQIKQERWVQCSQRKATTVFGTHGTKEREKLSKKITFV
jgi:hypothetical protein